MADVTGTDPTFEATADKTLTQLRALYEDARSKNGFGDDATMRAAVDAGPSSIFGFFDTTGKVSIAKNLLDDASRISELSGRLRQAAERGSLEDGSPYDWGRWATQADVVGSDVQANASYAWDASTLGPIIDATGATAHDVAVLAVKTGDALSSALTSPWLWGGLVVLGVLVVAGPSIVGRTLKGAAKAVTS